MPTLRGKLLLGWMSREEAIKLLREECVFDNPLTDQEAEGIWTTYKGRVDNLQARAVVAPERSKLLVSEQTLTKRILNKRKKQNATHLQSVVKICPEQLTVHQFVIVTELAERYIPLMDDPKQRAKTCLGLGFPPGQWTSQQNGDTLHIDLSHGEFNLGLNPGARQFIVQENARWITVHRYDNRMLLWAGYHRAYALLSSQTYPEDTERVLLAVETTEAERLLGFNSERPDRRDALTSARPPLLGDFFDEDLFMSVNLRKGHWRFEVHLPTLKPGRVWIHDAS